MSLKDVLDHHSRCHVDLPMIMWTFVDVNGQNKYETGSYYFVIPQNITKI